MINAKGIRYVTTRRLAQLTKANARTLVVRVEAKRGMSELRTAMTIKVRPDTKQSRVASEKRTPRNLMLEKARESGLTTSSSATAECGAAPAWRAERRRRKQVPCALLDICSRTIVAHFGAISV